jgi:hypothetical protein
MTHQFNYQTTMIGSVPFLDTTRTCSRIIDAVDIPIWPQMSKLNFRENMYTQFAAVLPSINIDDAEEKITFDTTGDITSPLEDFYSHFIAEDYDYFGLSTTQAAGFDMMLNLLANNPGTWVKGQVTGPISMGLTVTDQDLRASLYNDMLVDVLAKNAAMNARWQIRQLKNVRSEVMIFVDEPYMASFGSAYISLSREQVVGMLDEVFESIHLEGALAGVHCCANTDWSVLLATQVDILNLDAYEYLDNLALYPLELREFLDRGGIIAWGIVPNTQDIFRVTPGQLAVQLRKGIELICEKAAARGVSILPGTLDKRSLVTPACGLGPTTTEIADKVLEILPEVGKLMRT